MISFSAFVSALCGSHKTSEDFPPSLLWKSLCNIDIYFSCLIEFTSEPISASSFLCGKCLITNLMQTNFLFPPQSLLEGCVFQGVDLFYLWHKIVYNIFCYQFSFQMDLLWYFLFKFLKLVICIFLISLFLVICLKTQLLIPFC